MIPVRRAFSSERTSSSNAAGPVAPPPGVVAPEEGVRVVVDKSGVVGGQEDLREVRVLGELGAQEGGHHGAAGMLPAVVPYGVGGQAARGVGGVRRGDGGPLGGIGDRQGPVGVGDGRVDGAVDIDGRGIVVAQSHLAGVLGALPRAGVRQVDRGRVRGRRAVRGPPGRPFRDQPCALLEVGDGLFVGLLADGSVGAALQRAARPGHQRAQRLVLAVHVPQRVVAPGLGDGEVGGAEDGPVRLGPVGQERVDGGQASARGVGAAVQLVEGVPDLGEQQLGGEPGPRLTELPRGQPVRGRLGPFREAGGHPAGAELPLELLDGGQAPAVDEPVRVDEQVGEVVRPPLLMKAWRQVPGMRTPSAVRWVVRLPIMPSLCRATPAEDPARRNQRPTNSRASSAPRLRARSRLSIGETRESLNAM